MDIYTPVLINVEINVITWLHLSSWVATTDLYRKVVKNKISKLLKKKLIKKNPNSNNNSELWCNLQCSSSSIRTLVASQIIFKNKEWICWPLSIPTEARYGAWVFSTLRCLQGHEGHQWDWALRLKSCSPQYPPRVRGSLPGAYRLTHIVISCSLSLSSSFHSHQDFLCSLPSTSCSRWHVAWEAFFQEGKVRVPTTSW